MTYALRTIPCPDCRSNDGVGRHDPYESCDTCLGSRRMAIEERERPVMFPTWREAFTILAWRGFALIILLALLFGAAMFVRAL